MVFAVTGGSSIVIYGTTPDPVTAIFLTPLTGSSQNDCSVAVNTSVVMPVFATIVTLLPTVIVLGIALTVKTNAPDVI